MPVEKLSTSSPDTERPAWHILQISGPLDVEFATALAERAPVIGWEPERTIVPWPFDRKTSGPSRQVAEDLTFRPFPLLHGYARPPVSTFARTGPTVARVLRNHAHTQDDVLVCTVPYFAEVAELWPGPVVYWLTDLIREYPSSKGIDVEALDERMCRVATLLCPNSVRLREYLLRRGADPEKVLIVPNATRAMNVLSSPPDKPAELPASIRHLNSPVAGVIGNLAGNMDWLLLDEVVQRSHGLHWVFVGPTDMAVADAKQRGARTRVMQRENATFVGSQPYGELVHYARAFDVAVLPYLRCEPTYSGSSTRFYEHLAACRPMIATRAFEELLHKEPYLTLADTPEEMLRELDQLRSTQYNDGNLALRWQASLSETWQARTCSVHERLRLELRKAKHSQAEAKHKAAGRTPAWRGVPAG